MTVLSDEKALDVAIHIRDAHHAALWEEEKHFTWLLSIILGAQVAVLTTQRAIGETRTLVVLLLSLLGEAFVVVAIVCLRREGVAFVRANRTAGRCYNRLFPKSDHVTIHVGPENTPLHVLPFRLFTPRRMTVRDGFQLVFFSFGLAFLGMLLLPLFHAV